MEATTKDEILPALKSATGNLAASSIDSTMALYSLPWRQSPEPFPKSISKSEALALQQ